MVQKTIATTLAPSVNIQAVQGSLQVKGWDRSEVLLRTRDESAVFERQDDRILIRCLADCEVRLPRDASVIATKIHGNARFMLLEGELRIDQVLGSLAMRDIDLAQVGNIHGNLVVKQAVPNCIEAESVKPLVRTALQAGPSPLPTTPPW